MLDENFWKQYFKVYDLLNIVRPYKDLLQIIINELDPQPGELILDAGCGTCNLSSLIINRRSNVIAIDNVGEALEVCYRKSSDIKTYNCDISNRLPFGDSFFDKIVSNNTLYLIHKSKRKLVMDELYRVLKPGGKIVISNIALGFRPILIYLAHLIYRRKSAGLFITLKEIIEMLPATLKMFRYNKKIKESHENQQISFFQIGEQSQLLRTSGFKEISEEKSVYAGQALLVMARK